MRHNSHNHSHPTHAFAITPSDGGLAGIPMGLLLSLTYSEESTKTGNFIYVGGQTGVQTVAVVTKGGETVTFTGPPLGTLIPIGFTQVLATGTSCTNLIGMY